MFHNEDVTAVLSSRLKSLHDAKGASRLYEELEAEEKKLLPILLQERPSIEIQRQEYEHVICNETQKAYAQVAQEMEILNKSAKTYCELDSILSQLSQLYEVKSCALGVIEGISSKLDLQKAIVAAEAALEAKNYHSAASAMSPYIGGTQDDDSVNELRLRIISAIDAQIESKFNSELIELYVTLNDIDRALQVVSQHVKNLIIKDFENYFQKAQAQHESLVSQDRTEVVAYSAVVIQLARKVIIRLTNGGALLKPHINVLGTLQMTNDVYENVSAFFEKSLDDFFTSWNFFKEHLLIVDTNNLDGDSSYPKDFAQILDQFALFYRAISEYSQFVLEIVQECHSFIKEQHASQRSLLFIKKHEDEFLNIASLLEKQTRQYNLIMGTRKLMSYYLKFEKYYLLKCIEITSKENESCTNWSAFINDYFFIFKESFNRAKQTRNYYILSEVMELINLQLKDNLFNHITKMKRQFTAKFSRAADDASLEAIYTSINNLEQVVNCITFLKNESEKVTEQFKALTCETIASEFGQELESIEKKFQLIFSTQVRDALLSMGVVDSVANRFYACNYEMTESEIGSFQINDSWVYIVLENLKRTSESIQSNLSSRVTKIAYLYMARLISLQLESLIMRKRYNSLGAERLDQQVLLVVSFFTKLNPICREPFSKTLQIISLLSVDSLEDLKFEKYSNLSANDVKKIICLRNEFSPSQVDSLMKCKR